MTRFINAVLIAFVTLVPLVALIGHMNASDGQPPGQPSITATQARWGHADGRPAIVVDVTLQNPLAVGTTVERISHLAIVDYVLAGQGSQSLALAVPARRDTIVPVTIPLKDAFVGEWWSSIATGRTSAALHVSGVVTLRGPDGVHELPFKWDSSGEYDVLGPVSDAMQGCDDGGMGLCLAETEATWDAGDLHVALHVRNQGPEAAVLRSSAAQLEFDEWVVAAGNSSLSLALAPGEEGEVVLALAFSRASMEEWWPGHVNRCEMTPVEVAVQLDVEHPAQDPGNGTLGPSPGEESLRGPEVSTLQWRFVGEPFQTTFICGGAP